MMHTAKIISLTEHRGGPRLWTQGAAAIKSGFVPGERFTVSLEGKTVVLRLDPQGERTVSRKVSAGGKAVPVIDINSAADLAPVANQTAVRVTFEDARVVISPIAAEVRRARRVERLRDRLAASEPLRTAGIAAGGGILTHAVHTGLADALVGSKVAVLNEIREDLVDHVRTCNDALDTDTALINVPLQEFAFDQDLLSEVGEVDVLEVGIPCSGASLAGRAKNGAGMAEEHAHVGHLIVGTLALVARLNPAVAIFECVTQYARTASAALMRAQLRDLGYTTHEREMFGPDFGELEARRRWCMVAVSRGVELDMETFVPQLHRQRTLFEVLEHHEAAGVMHRWSTMPGLKAKAVRDAAAGNNFKMQIYTGEESQIGVLTKGISRNRSTDPKIQHPNDPELLRVPTAREHARCKGIPEHLVAGLSHTVAHELLGQSVVYGAFRQLARFIGMQASKWAGRVQCAQVAAMPAFKVAA